MSITAVILTVDPSHLFERCMESVRRQTLQPSRIEVVRNVMPVAAALDEGLRRVQTEYFVLVDDDMVLNEDCFARLRALITENPKRADVVCMLMDPLVGKTGGIHIYRTRVLREIGFNAKNHTDELRWVEEQLSLKGYEKYSDKNKIVGEHHPVYLPAEAYWKFKMRAEKCRVYRDGYPWLKRTANALCEHWRQAESPVFFYAIAGLVDGLRTTEQGPLTYEGREKAPGYVLLNKGLNECRLYDPGQESAVGLTDLEKEKKWVEELLKRIDEHRVLDYFTPRTILAHLFRRFLKFLKRVRVTRQSALHASDSSSVTHA